MKQVEVIAAVIRKGDKMSFADVNRQLLSHHDVEHHH